jgi:hypothetical protein
MIDLVAPKGNEYALIARAEQLGYTGLVLVYPRKDLPRELPASKLKLQTAAIVSAQEAQRRHGTGICLVMAERDKERAAIEAGPAVVFGLERTQPKDGLHARNSGLNQVLAAIAKRKGVAIGIALSWLLAETGAERARLLGRISQNILICRKSGARMALASGACTPDGMRSPHDLMALGRVLGMTPEESKASLEWLPPA